MARKRTKPEAAPATTPAQAEANLRRGNEYYSMHIGLPKMFSRGRDFVSATLLQIQNARVPELDKRAVIAETNSLSFYLDALDTHIQHGDIAQAVLAAVEVGRASQMIVRMEQEHLLLREIGRETGKRKRDIGRKAEEDRRKKWVKKAYAEMSDKDKERGTTNVERKLANQFKQATKQDRKMAKQMGQRTISTRTVRRYLNDED